MCFQQDSLLVMADYPDNVETVSSVGEPYVAEITGNMSYVCSLAFHVAKPSYKISPALIVHLNGIWRWHCMTGASM